MQRHGHIAYDILQNIRRVLSYPVISLPLCLIGLLAGFIAASVIIAFKAILILWHHFMLGEVAYYAALEPIYRLALPTAAVLVILAIAAITGFKHYRLGIPFVIHRMNMFYGHIPFGSTINQFFGGILALGSGFVVGKEGPTVHLAAAAGHYLGRWMRLPFNSLRIIAGCGIAAGIAAAFNTPFAAVIFVMEVVLRDYKVHIFLPIMLAAAVGSVLTRLAFGDVHALSFLSFSPITGIELLYLIAFGFIIGCAAALFNYQLMFLMKTFRPINMFARLFIAAFITGLAGFFFPESLSADFMTIAPLFDTQTNLLFLFSLLVIKFMLACIAISLGVPGGIIGAAMIIGSLIGLVFITGLSYVVDTGTDTTYALLGLAGFLASVLYAPMAALSAAMELAADSRVVLPAIIVIVCACITSKQLFNCDSIFTKQLDFQQLPYTTSAVRDWLQQAGVLSLIDANFEIVENKTNEQLLPLLQANSDKIIIHQQVQENKKNQYHWVGLNLSLDANDNSISKQPTYILTQQHTLADVHDALHRQRKGAVLIVEQTSSEEEQFCSIEQLNEYALHVQDLKDCNVKGIITWDTLRNYLLKKQH